MSEITDDQRENAMQVMGELSGSFNVMLGATQGKLDTPVEIETSASGDDEAECLGSVRHIAEFIEEQDHGYTVEIEQLGESEPLPSNEMRHRYRLTIRGDDE